MHVHLFMHGERYWNSVLDETESRIVEERLKKEGVQIHAHTELFYPLRKRSMQARRGRISSWL